MSVETRRINRAARRAAGKRTPMEFPVPQPTTPFSKNVVPLTGPDYMLARTGAGHAAVLKLFRKFGAFNIKPHRNSAGVIWRGHAYWWSSKGYYRPGLTNGRRRPLQHLVWEHHNARPMPQKHEVFFKDRNRNNFNPANLELLSKSDLHKRITALGENNQPTLAERKEISSKRWLRHTRNVTALLLKNHQQKDTNEHSTQIEALIERRKSFNK